MARRRRRPELSRSAIHLFPVAAYALGRLAAIAWEEARSHRGPRCAVCGLVAALRLLDLALIMAGVVRTWACGLGSRAARAGVRGAVRPSGELGLNTGDEENPIRRLVSTFLSPLASAYALVVALIYVFSRPFRWWWGRARASPLRRAALHAYACGVRLRSCSGSSFSRSRNAGSRPIGDRRRDDRRSRRSSSSRTRRSGRRRATRQRSSSGSARTPSRQATRAATRWRATTRRRRATGAICETASGSFSTTRRGTGSGMLASSRSGPASRSAPGSRPTRSSASMRASRGSSRSSSGASRSSRGYGDARPGSQLRSRPSWSLPSRRM